MKKKQYIDIIGVTDKGIEAIDTFKAQEIEWVDFHNGDELYTIMFDKGELVIINTSGKLYLRPSAPNELALGYTK